MLPLFVSITVWWIKMNIYIFSKCWRILIEHCVQTCICTTVNSIKPLTPAVATWLQLYSILCQTGLSRHLFLISGHSDAHGWASECPDVKNCEWRCTKSQQFCFQCHRSYNCKLFSTFACMLKTELFGTAYSILVCFYAPQCMCLFVGLVSMVILRSWLELSMLSTTLHFTCHSLFCLHNITVYWLTYV